MAAQHTSLQSPSVSAGQWPTEFDIFAFARKGEQLEGTLTLQQLPRMIAEMAPDAPASAGQEVFTWSIRGTQREEFTEGQTRQRLFVQVQLAGGIWLTCQRCLQPYFQALTVSNTLEVMRSEEQADAAPLDDDEADPIVGSRQFDVLALLEDELLLSLPLAPKHVACPDDVEAQQVASLVQLEAEPGAEVEVEVKRPSPFAALAGLKIGKK